MSERLVRICDPDHPHFPEAGTLTGKVISLLGTSMAEMTLDSCRHGTDGCFVRHGQVASLEQRIPERKAKP